MDVNRILAERQTLYFIRVNRVRVLQSEADIVQSFEQAMALKIANPKSSEEPISISDDLVFEINC